MDSVALGGRGGVLASGMDGVTATSSATALDAAEDAQAARLGALAGLVAAVDDKVGRVVDWGGGGGGYVMGFD